MTPRATAIVIAIPSVVAGVLLCAISVAAFGSILRPGILPELLLVLYLTCAFAGVQRRLPVAAAVVSIVVIAVYAASFAKWMVFDEPLLLADLGSADELWRSVAWPWRVAAASLSAVTMAAAILNLRLPSRREAMLFAPVFLFVAAAFVAPAAVLRGMDIVRPDIYWRPVSRMWRAGPIFSLARQVPESVRLRRTLARVEGPADRLRLDAASLRRPLPDVHVLVMESFIDPRQFRATHFARDPVDPRVRRWLDEGASAALSPTFGGQTARAEFELLCGVPSYAAFGVEMNLIERDVPCLPRVLQGAGYRTWASVPVAPSFFRVGRAYPALGFEQRFFAPDFDLSDMDGLWLTDAATLGQTEARLRGQRVRGRPTFNYVVTTAGHEPFDRRADRRPAVVAGDDWIARMANGIHYSSVAVGDFVDAVEAGNPNTIVVVVGDHLPIFGTANRAFATSGYVPAGAGGSAAPWTMDSLATRMTPLIIRDRGRTVRAGMVPHYAIAEMLLDRITDGRWCRDDCPGRGPVVYRPLGSEPAFAAVATFPDRVCADAAGQDARCNEASRRHEELQDAYDRLMAAAIGH